MEINLCQTIPLPAKSRPIVIIGTGGIVTDAHLPAYRQADWTVLGIFDQSLEKAQAAQARFPFVKQVFSSLDELIKVGLEENAVFDLAVPADQILSILEKLPEGAAVLIQKPMGESLAEAMVILEFCEKKQLVAAVNFQLKFAPYMLALRDLIDQKILGEIFDLELKVCVFTPWELWDFLGKKPRMEVLYHSIHYLDLIRSILGNPSCVMASLARHPDTPHLAEARSSILMEFGGFKQARVLTNHGHNYGPKHQESYLKVEGTKGAAYIRIGLSLDYPKGQPSFMEYCLKANSSTWQEIPIRGDWFPEAFVGSMAVLQNHLQDPIQYPLTHSVQDAIQTMALVEQVYHSASPSYSENPDLSS